ncbi:hypothetical protein B0H13DRAFT_1865097 [Mycena leptocephala]|nr:hypothetical protein B0H13DRAFT_1865097 [Mycena leptocephala]
MEGKGHNSEGNLKAEESPLEKCSHWKSAIYVSKISTDGAVGREFDGLRLSELCESVVNGNALREERLRRKRDDSVRNHGIRCSAAAFIIPRGDLAFVRSTRLETIFQSMATTTAVRAPDRIGRGSKCVRRDAGDGLGIGRGVGKYVGELLYEFENTPNMGFEGDRIIDVLGGAEGIPDGKTIVGLLAVWKSSNVVHILPRGSLPFSAIKFSFSKCCIIFTSELGAVPESHLMPKTLRKIPYAVKSSTEMFPCLPFSARPEVENLANHDPNALAAAKQHAPPPIGRLDTNIGIHSLCVGEMSGLTSTANLSHPSASPFTSIWRPDEGESKLLTFPPLPSIHQESILGREDMTEFGSGCTKARRGIRAQHRRGTEKRPARRLKENL